MLKQRYILIVTLDIPARLRRQAFENFAGGVVRAPGQVATGLFHAPGVFVNGAAQAPEVISTGVHRAPGAFVNGVQQTPGKF